MINKLPRLVVFKILNYLNLKEKVQFKSVCKRLNEIDVFYQNSLCIHQDNYPFNLTYSVTNKLVGYHNSISFLNEKFERYDFPLKRIKKLYISSIWFLNDLRISLNKLNYFENLEQLQIEGTGQLDEDTRFSFKQLKILSLNKCTFNFWLELDCPSLQTFVCWSNEIQNLKFNYPLKLKSLELFKYDPLIKRFQNLECLSFLCFKTIDLDINKKLIKLKELNLNLGNYMHLDLEEFHSLKSNLEGTNLKINVTFFKLAKCLESKRLLLDESNLGIVKNNYCKLQNCLNWTFELNYSSLFKEFNCSIPTDFHLKFKIQQVEINEQITDSRQFFTFLNNCTHLRELHINGLNQFPYHQLHCLSTLEALKITKSNFAIISDLPKGLKNLDFILNDKNEMNSISHLAISALLKCVNLKNLIISDSKKVVSKLIWIKRTRNFYSLILPNLEIIFTNLTRLINHLKQNEMPIYL